MKKLLVPVISLFNILAFSSCSEKFDVGAPYKDITVVNGFLAMSDTAHYIRIQKAFLDQDVSALTLAKIPDSNFYANLNVRIDRYDENGRKSDSIHLKRVNLNDEGYPKEPGIFFDAPNYAYKFTNLLDAQYKYRLIITNLQTGNIDSAEAPIINDKSKTVLKVDVTDDSTVYLAGLDFASTKPSQRFEIKSSYSSPNSFSPVAIAQAVMRFNWQDSNIITNSKTAYSYDHNLGYKLAAGNQYDFRIQNTVFYDAVRDGMGLAPTNTVRLIDRCDIFVYYGTPDFRDYQATSQIAGTGLTGNEIQPVYTNIKGKDVLGLFTSRGMRTGRLTITRNTIDSLKVSAITKDVNIRGTVYH